MNRHFPFGVLLSVLMVSSLASADSESGRCARQAADEPVLEQTDFHWGYSLPEMLTRFNEVYSSGKRLRGRAYLDPATNQYLIDMDVPWNGMKKVVVHPRFIQSVTRHVEEAIRLKYVHAIFFRIWGIRTSSCRQRSTTKRSDLCQWAANTSFTKR